MLTRVLPLLALATLLAAPARAASDVQITAADDRLKITVAGKPFTEYIFKGMPRPILYPVLAADGTEMTRHYPMRKGVAGEVEDHPHHRSLWFTHGDVNGIDFWAENSDKKGRIVNQSVTHAVADGAARITSRNRWTGPDGAVHLEDETVIRLHGTGDARFIDYEVTLKAPAGKPAVLGDTKEGSMAIRLPLWMTPTHSQGRGKKHEGKGTIVNAEGVRNDAAWGKRSAWVDYHAPRDGKVYGVAMFDHPANPRHPTWWHVRTYALFAANPFGKHDFENLKDQPKAGEMVIPAGGSVTFRWRFYFHFGDERAGRVAEQYQAYATRR